MVKKGKKRIIKIPKVQDLGPLKEIEIIRNQHQEEEKRIEEEKIKQEELEKRRKKQLEDDIKRHEEERFKKEEKEKFLKEQSEKKEKELKEDIVDIPEGFCKREIYTNQDEENEGVVIKYSGEKPDEFLYKVQPSEFQKNLKEFFSDIPNEDSDGDGDLIKISSIEKQDIHLKIDKNSCIIPNQKEIAEPVEEFNVKVRKRMVDRNRLSAPQSYRSSYTKVKAEKQEVDLEKRVIMIKNTAVKNKNLTITGRRSNAPISRTNNKISTNRML